MNDHDNSDKPNILVVDDTPANLVAMKSLLQNVKANVITASSGNETLSTLLRHDFALILLDVQMPDMDGFETARLISQCDVSRQTPIIFVTARERDEDQTFKGYDLGAVDYLYKPINPHILLSKVKIFLRLHEQKLDLAKGKSALIKLLEEKDDLVKTVQQQYVEKDSLLTKIKAQNEKLKRYGKIWILVGITSILTLGSGAFFLQAKTMNDRLSQLNTAYKRFVPYDLLELLDKNHITQIHLGDQILKEMTVMFVDVRGYTSLCENLTPRENIALINSIFGTLQPAIQEHRGIINKYLGDGLMALFPHGADDAVNAAISMLKNLNALSKERTKQNLAPIRIGIGLDGGELMLGTVGLEKRMEQTVVADAVNVASRIEGATKFYNASLLISGYVYEHLSDPNRYTSRFVDEVRLVGKHQPTSIYQIFDGDDEEILLHFKSTKQQFEQGVKAFREKHFTTSRFAFSQVLSTNSKDAAAKLYLDRIDELLENGISDSWSPIRVLTAK
jgi:class 3 adenylate cyclase/DNA-binding response OmpR family regulator